METRQVEGLRDGVTKFPDPDEGAISDFGPSLTRQSEAAHTDINVIMAQYARNGTLPVNVLQGRFEDVSAMVDYREALETVRQADEAFMELDAKVRSRFDNDPATFLEFFNTPGNEAELRDMGLMERPAVPAAPVAPAQQARNADGTFA